jgi:hypothetical protein
MITCFIKYVIDARKVEQFELYGKRWIALVNKHGGEHHGYFLPAEGADNVAYALFSFPSLHAYERYRSLFASDPEFIAANAYNYETGCVVSHERTFLRPVFQ